MEEQKDDIRGTFNGRDQGPDGRVHHIRSFVKRKNSDGTITAETYNVAQVLLRLFADAGGVGGPKSIAVLDERIAEYTPETGYLTMKAEGRNMVYASGTNAMGQTVFVTA